MLMDTPKEKVIQIQKESTKGTLMMKMKQK